MTTEILVKRLFDDGDTTVGIMKQTEPPIKLKELLGYTCEDQFREGPKVAKETRIAAGRYKLVINKAETGLTIKHRTTYNIAPFGTWFKYHIMLEGVPNFSGIYIHAGNTDDHTEGCLLLGNTLNNPLLKPARTIENSIAACAAFYARYYPLIEAGKEVYITIEDE